MKILKVLLFMLIVGNLSAEIARESDELNKNFDKYKFEKSILIYDQKNNSFIGHNLKRCNEGFLPASTFKIPNTLIAFETGVVTSLDQLFKWNKEKRSFDIWEKDMTLEEAFKVSCVPIYQEIAKKIGTEKMKYYTTLLNYGNLQIDSNNINEFWLVGNSEITSFQQIYFLERLYNLKFPISKEAMESTKKIMISEVTDSYTLSAKTGTTRNGIGWYVGYVETKDNVFYFATNIYSESKDPEVMDAKIRKEITKESLKLIGAIE